MENEIKDLPFMADVTRLNKKVIALRLEILKELKEKYPQAEITFSFTPAHNDLYVGVNIDLSGD